MERIIMIALVTTVILPSVARMAKETRHFDNACRYMKTYSVLVDLRRQLEERARERE